MTTGIFDAGLRGERCWLETAAGGRIALAVDRWAAPPGVGDASLLDPCAGPTLDVGCGPGRLTAALMARGVVALGVDTSPTAVALTRRRGASALCRDVYDRLPGEGRWQHVLLADGNVGIGGDPVRLLGRARELLSARGSAVVEVDPPGSGIGRGRARLAVAAGAGPWFDWGWLAADAVPGAAAEAGLAVRWVREHVGRWFTELVPR
ncbi:class I SAM-dependent methyltransferase [Actinokineospora spheciospongiae]|uniref:class I SAM-dependent methyltransferase n=1 Tax=Actinokineospora spheciospongiae TaxID=909613 RepID=UPI000D71BAB2|nr:class I SAM-dependent methyltransferase [Actinokineospora spheciospongiae]PWW65588.1 methyltransferase family protein [Actinokineospora spheciospongiae]